MKRICTALLIGAAAIGIGAMAPAAARALSAHEMTVLLPSGATETIRYTGNVAPKVSFDAPAALGDPLVGAWVAPAPSFIGFDRIAAQLDREMNVLWRESLPDISQVALGQLPAGTESYSVITESNGNNVCRRMTEVIRPENGGRPKTVTHVSGDCGALSNPGAANDRVRGDDGHLTRIHWLQPAFPYQ